MSVFAFTVVAAPPSLPCRAQENKGRIAAVDVHRHAATSGTTHDNIGLMLVKLGLGDSQGGVKVIVGQGRIQDLVADDARQGLADLYRLDVLGTWAFGALAFREGHTLAFTQFVKTDAFEAI
jgi:hypothetical protein